MANILLVDAANQSGHLALALFRGLRHKGSLSTSREEALLKAETGLFDIFYVDVDSAHPIHDVRLIHQIDVLFPGAPILRVSDPDLELPVQPVFIDLFRPLSLENLATALRRATARLAELSVERRRHSRRAVDFEVEVTFLGHRLGGRAVDLSPGGARVELARFEPCPSEASGIRVDLEPAGGAFDVAALVAYACVSPAGRPLLGISFGSLGAPERMRLAVLCSAS